MGIYMFLTKIFSWPYSFSVVENRSALFTTQTVGFYTGSRNQISFHSWYILKETFLECLLFSQQSNQQKVFLLMLHTILIVYGVTELNLKFISTIIYMYFHLFENMNCWSYQLSILSLFYLLQNERKSLTNPLFYVSFILCILLLDIKKII